MPAATDFASTTRRFRHSFFRSLLVVAQRYPSLMMQLLEGEKGHRHLRLSYQNLFLSIPKAGLRPSQLAEKLGMKKQNTGQLLKQVEEEGYITRGADPDDQRAQRIYLSERGKQLIRDGIDVTTELDRAIATLIGEQRFREVQQSLSRLVETLPSRQQDNQRTTDKLFVTELIALSEFYSATLLEMLREKGHQHFKLSHRHVMLHIDTEGSRIQALADASQISKQAIAKVVAEMQALGYLEISPDPLDGRSKIVKLAGFGRQFMVDSVAAADQLTERFKRQLGAATYRALESGLATLHGHLYRAFSNAEILQLASGEMPARTEQYRLKEILALMLQLDQGVSNDSFRLLEPTHGKQGELRCKPLVLDQLAELSVSEYELSTILEAIRNGSDNK